MRGTDIEPSESAQFEVALAASPNSLVWLKDNQPIDCTNNPSGRIQMEQCNKLHEYKLTIRQAKAEDSGTYTALAENDSGKASCSAQLIVHELTTIERLKRAQTDKPEFLVGMKDTELLQDTYLRFMVKVKGEPNPDVKFFKDGTKIGEQLEHYQIVREHSDRGFYELVVHELRKEDAGVYKCVATNKFGEACTEASVTVTDHKDILDEMKEGEILPSGETPQFHWKKDGVPIEPEERFKVLMGDDEDSLALVFQHVRPEDVGLYTCVAQTSRGHISCSAELTVHGTINQLFREPEKPTLVIEKRDPIVAAGGSVMLELQIKGYPKPTVKWSHEGKQIEPSAKYKILYEDEENVSLVIKDVQSEDAGKYEIEAQNELGSDSAEMTLTVKQAPKISCKTKDVSVHAGIEFDIPIKIEGFPKPTVTFYKDGKEIKDAKIINDENDVYKLHFDKITLKDSGSYSVTASNELAQVSDFWQTNVFSKPTIIKKLGSQIVASQRESFVLEVRMEAEPAAEVKWFKGDEEIRQGDRYSIESNGDSHRLKVSGTITTDAAKYKMKAINIHGTVDDETIVYVKKSPNVVQPLHDMTVNEHDKNVTLDVKIDAYPKPAIKWYLDELEITETRNEFTKVEYDDGVKLVIKEVNSELSGQYTCKLSNECGVAETSAKLIVNCSPRIRQQLKDTIVEENATLHLEVQVEATPTPTVKWLRNGTEVNADARIKITRDTKRYETFSLNVDLVKPDDQGEYEVVVTNSMGSISNKSFVTVHTAPTIIESDMNDGSRPESLGVTYTVCGKSNPPPTASWTVNGKEIKPNSHLRMTTSQDGDKFQLEITKLEMKDAGTYECILSNALGKVKKQATLEVTPEKELRRPKVKQGLQDQTVVKKQSLTLKAVIVGDPVPAAEWFMNGTQITDADMELYKIIVETDHHDISDGLNECSYSLTIPRCERCHGTTFKLVAKNKWDQCDTSANVTIVLKPEITGPDNTSAVPGEAAQFTAVVQSNPPPDIIWTKNDALVTANENIDIVSDVANETYKLIFKTVLLSDEGYYKIVAKNHLGEESSEARLKAITEKPRFITVLSDEQVQHCGEIVLKVRADALPKPEIKWSIGGKAIEPDERHTIETHTDAQVTSTLKVSDFQESDSALYKVLALNVVGEAECQANIRMLQTAPSFGKKLERAEEVSEGEPLELRAKISGSPNPIVTWYKNGEPLVESDNIKTTHLSDGTIKLNIDHCKPEDSGAYKLMIRNANGEASSLCAVAVAPNAKPPEFLKFIQDAHIPSSDTLRLEAKVCAYPAPELKWLKNGAPIRSCSTIHIENHPDGTAVLIIDCVRPEHAGQYELLASNRYGEAITQARIEVDKRPTKPEFVKRLQPQTVVVGFPVKFEVRVTGHPIPTIIWTRNGIEVIPDNKHIRIHSEADGTVSHLLLDAADEVRDALTYRAIASNEAGEAETACQLTVTPATDDGLPEEKPQFKHMLKDVSTDEDQPLVLQTMIVGNPVPSVEWRKDGEPIKDNDRILMTCDGQRIALSIDHALPSDAGQYEVTLTNPLGQDKISAKATVHKIFMPPQFSQKFTDLQQIPGRDAKFPCRVLGVPQPDVSWSKNGIPICESDKYHIKRDGDACCLYIIECDSSDSGVYRATAINKEGQEICTASLEVVQEIKMAQKLEPAAFLKRIGDTELFKGMTAKFTACATGAPEPNVEWFHDDTKLFPSNRIRMETDRAGLLRLSISGVDVDDLGKYSCRIWNEHGSDMCHATLSLDAGIEPKEKRSMTDQYIDFDKYKRTGAPMPIHDPPIIAQMTDRHCTLSWKPSIPSGAREPVTYQLEMCELPHGDWFTVRTGIRSCTCGVRNLEPFHDYKFRIRVENKYGVSDPSPYAITHREKLEPESPKFHYYLPLELDFRPDTSPYFPKDFDIERPPHDNMAQAPRFLRQEHSTQYGVRDQSADLFWFVYGYPKPKINFYFEDELIESGGRFDMSYTRNGQATLFINKMLDRDVGMYEAVAINEHGETRQRVRLEIAELPTFVTKPQVEYVMQRGKSRFETHIHGVPYPCVKWYKDWKPLATSSRTKIQFIEPDKHVLIVNDIICKDQGLYSVSARNVAGSVSCSAMLYVEENDLDFNFHTYTHIPIVKIKHKPYDGFYDLGDELGRGTQGMTYHAVERINGMMYGAKIMHGRGDLRPFLYNEYEMMNHLHHRKLIALHDVYEFDDTLAMFVELGAGGELVPDYLLKMDFYTERDIAGFVRQMLQGVEYMHERGFGHMGLTLGDLLISHPGGDDLKIADFGLTRRINLSCQSPLYYGVPEYVSPEVANGDGVGLAHDMWSIGIITYILLSGRSPFRGADDRETLMNIQSGKWIFDDSWWCHMSHEVRDFITKLLVYQSDCRMDVHHALRHPWLDRADKIYHDEYQISSKYLSDYWALYRNWYDNASCKRWLRRNKLETAFTHHSRMVYPPGEYYSPRATPVRSPIKIPTWEDHIPARSPLNYEIGCIKSESHYQNGPDTYLLQLRDVNFPVRLREYMKVAGSRGPGGCFIISDENGYNWHTPTIRERRRFTDIMDEEIDDERKERINRYGVCESNITNSYSIRRLRHELGSRLDTYVETEALLESKQEGRLPFIREKPQTTAMVEGHDVELTCLAVGDPQPIIQWFKNDAILAESHRIQITVDEDNRSHLKLCPALSFDQGQYKVVARNKIGQTVAHTRIVIGLIPDAPDSPEPSQVADREVLLIWKQPKYDGNSQVLCYRLDFKLADAASEWNTCADNIDHEFYVLRNLEPDTNYIFRLAARNAIGWSEAGVASAPIRTLISSPDVPRIQLSQAMQHLQQITDSGQPVEIVQTRHYPNYHIETHPIEWESRQTDVHDTYNFISELNKGRYSAVLKAIDKNTDNVVVAKVLQLKGRLDEVEGEFAALRSLRHERIALLLSAYHTKTDLSIFVLEKLQGADVLTYLASRHEYTEQTVATIITQILDGLQYLHWRSLCHLDLQPDNVVMCTLRSVQIKLVDMGSAHRVTKMGAKVPVLGHADYVAPEVISEELVYPQTDIWSVAVLMYVMLSGVLPFRGSSEDENRQNILFVRYRFEHLFKEISQESTRFLMLLFKRQPIKRPTAEECHENRWLLNTDFMIKKRERNVFLGNRLKQYSEEYHNEKAQLAQDITSQLGGRFNRSHSIQDELLTAP